MAVGTEDLSPPSPRGLNADSNRPRQRRKRPSSSQARGKLASRGADVEVINRGAESKSSTSSTHPSLGRPYTPSLPDDSGDADIDAEYMRKASSDSNPNSLSSKEAESIHQLETPESSVHCAPITSLGWTNSPVTDSLASSIAKDDGGDNAYAAKCPPFDHHMTTVSTAVGVVILGVAAAAVIWRVKPE